MNIALIVIGSGLLGFLVWATWTWSTPTAAARVARVQAGRVGLVLDPAEAGRVEQRLANRVLVGAAGGVGGGAGLSAWLVTAGISGGWGWLLVWCAVGVLLGRSMFLAGLALIEAWRAVPQPGLRVARASSPRLGDYVAAHERGFAVVASGLPLVLVTGWWASPGRSGITEFPTSTAALAAVPLLVLVAGVLLARRIVSRGQPAASTRALAWDDALRARTLRDVTAAVTLVGISYSLLTALVEGAIPFTDRPFTAAVTVPAAVLLLAAGIVAALSAVTPSPGSHFKRRLWSHDQSAGSPVDEKAAA